MIASIFVVVIGITLCAIVIENPNLGAQVVPAVTLAVIATLFASFNSRWLAPFVLAVWALEPEIRRIVDYDFQSYTSVTILSVTPMLCTIPLIIPIVRRWSKLTPELRLPTILFAIAFAYAAIIGIVKNGLTAIYDLAQTILPMLFLFYLVLRKLDIKERSKWLSEMVVIGVLVAIYGWVQFVTAPPWDMFWLTRSGMTSMGTPQPLMFRMFSTLNSTGPAAGFLATTAALALTDRRWRGTPGWLGVALMGTAVAITEVRAVWLTLIITIVGYVALGSKKARWQALVGVGVTVLLFVIIIPRMPGGDVVVQRTQTLNNLGQDKSANARQSLVTSLLPTLLSDPMGQGFGGTGVGSKLQGETVNGSLDNGYLTLLETYGVIGFPVYIAAFLLLAIAVSKMKSVPGNTSPVAISLATLVATIVALMGYDVLTGVSAVWIWFVIGIPLGTFARTAEIDSSIRAESSTFRQSGQFSRSTR